MIIIACIIWALTFPAIKIELDYIPPIILGAVRYFIGSLPILAFLAYKHELKDSFIFFRTHWKYIVALGIFMVTIPNMSQNIGMQYTTASLSAIIQSIGPVITIILAVVFLREKMNRYRVLGIGMALVCSILLIYEGGVSVEEVKIIGNVLVFISAVSYGINGVIGKMALKTHTPLVLVGYSMLVGAIILFPISFMFEDQGWVYDQTNLSITLLLALAFFPCSIATLMWFVALKSLPLSKQVIYVFLIPIVATIFSVLVLDETLTMIAILLGALTIIGVAIAQYERKRKSNKNRVFSEDQ